MQNIVMQHDTADDGLDTWCTDQVLDLDDQRTGARTAVGDIEAFQGDALPIEAGDHGAGMAQDCLVGLFGYDKDSLGKLAAQLHLPVVHAGAHPDRTAIGDVEQSVADGHPDPGSG